MTQLDLFPAPGGCTCGGAPPLCPACWERRRAAVCERLAVLQALAALAAGDADYT